MPSLVPISEQSETLDAVVEVVPVAPYDDPALYPSAALTYPSAAGTYPSAGLHHAGSGLNITGLSEGSETLTPITEA